MKKSGFTLIELLAVVAILAILAIIALPNILEIYHNTRQKAFLAEVNNIIKVAKQQYFLEGALANSWSNAEGSTKVLQLTNNENITYYVAVNDNGQVIKLLATNGTYQYRYDGIIDFADAADIKTISNLNNNEVFTVNPNGVMDITCNNGYYLEKGKTECTKCPAGYYCSSGSYVYNADVDQGNNKCPGEMTSSIQSSSITSCKATCAAGYYLPMGTGECNALCLAGSYCPGGSATYSETQDKGITACPGSLTSAGGTSSTAETKCYANCSSGTYLPRGATACTTCPSDSTCSGGKLYYNKLARSGITSPSYRITYASNDSDCAVTGSATAYRHDDFIAKIPTCSTKGFAGWTATSADGLSSDAQVGTVNYFTGSISSFSSLSSWSGNITLKKNKAVITSAGDNKQKTNFWNLATGNGNVTLTANWTTSYSLEPYYTIRCNNNYLVASWSNIPISQLGSVKTSLLTAPNSSLLGYNACKNTYEYICSLRGSTLKSTDANNARYCYLYYN